MKIAFYPGNCLPFHGCSLEERPLGGTETGIIRLAEALSKLGHQVTVLTDGENPPLTEPLYLPKSSLELLGPVEVFISVRQWEPLFLPIEAKVKCLWTGDSFDQPSTIGIGDKRIADQVDVLLTVSNWHKTTLTEQSGFPTEKCFVIGNGVHTPYFEGSEERNRKRLFYSSTPYRGLTYLPEIFSKIHAVEPTAELHVYSGFGVYQGAPTPIENLREFQQLCHSLMEIPGIFLHGNLLQKELAQEMMKSGILAYPNTFEETSCITALEAMAAGCVVVTSAKGALPETVGEGGVCIGGEPGTQEYTDTFVHEVLNLFSHPSYFEDRSRKNKEKAQSFSWEARAERFIAYLTACYNSSLAIP